MKMTISSILNFTSYDENYNWEEEQEAMAKQAMWEEEQEAMAKQAMIEEEEKSLREQEEAMKEKAIIEESSTFSEDNIDG